MLISKCIFCAGAQVYFDTYDKNTGGGSIIQAGQKAAYKELNGLKLFTQNDNCAKKRFARVATWGWGRQS